MKHYALLLLAPLGVSPLLAESREQTPEEKIHPNFPADPLTMSLGHFDYLQEGFKQFAKILEANSTKVPSEQEAPRFTLKKMQRKTLTNIIGADFFQHTYYHGKAISQEEGSMLMAVQEYQPNGTRTVTTFATMVGEDQKRHTYRLIHSEITDASITLLVDAHHDAFEAAQDPNYRASRYQLAFAQERGKTVCTISRCTTDDLLPSPAQKYYVLVLANGFDNITCFFISYHNPSEVYAFSMSTQTGS